jgi:outer membrane protein TolC
MYNRIAVLLCFAGFVGTAQESLKLEDAIRLALQKNYAVQTASNGLEIAKSQNNLGAAGITPTISLNGSLNASVLNSSQIFNNGTTQDREGARSNGLNASLNADWMVFDGMRMFAVKKRLGLSQELSNISMKSQAETVIYEVMLAYYDVARVTELLKAGRENIRLYEERKKIADVRLQIGADSKVESMMAAADLNRAISTQYQLELQLLQVKTKLNTLLQRNVSLDFKAVDSMQLNWNPALDELKKAAGTGNTGLLMAKQNELIANQSLAEARASNLPFVTVNGAYVFTRTQSQAGFLFSNRQNGLNVGLTAGWVLYNGGRNSNLQKERALQVLNQKLWTEETLSQVDALVYVQFQSFLLNQKIVTLEQVNLRDAKELQSISLERYRVGKTNLLETIETQKNLEDAQSRFINALYSTKVAETALLKSNGSLVK